MSARVWVVSQYEGTNADGYAIYSLTGDRLQLFTRMMERSANRLAKKLRAGHTSKRASWDIPLNQITKIDFDADSGHQVISVKRKKFTIRPDTNWQRSTSTEIYEDLISKLDSFETTTVEAGGNLRLTDVMQPVWWIVIPIWPGFVIDTRLGLAATALSVAVVVYRWFTAPPTLVSRTAPRQDESSTFGELGSLTASELPSEFTQV